MSITLRDALDETMLNWKEAVPEAWRQVFANVELNSNGVPTKWKHDPWVPIFPVFKNYATREIFQAGNILKQSSPNLIGIPYYAHTFRAFLVQPENVRVVIVGQDPYPKISDATGQSFEQGNLSGWVEDAHNVASSLRAIIKLAAANHTRNVEFSKPKPSNFEDPGWAKVVEELATGGLKLAPPDNLFVAYQQQGVLWLNTTLSISLFRTPPGKDEPGYQMAHAEYWKPFVSRLFEYLVSRDQKPVVFGLWGAWAKGFKNQIAAAAKAAATEHHVRFVEAGHPVTNQFLERSKNVLTEINENLAELGGKLIEWLPN